MHSLLKFKLKFSGGGIKNFETIRRAGLTATSDDRPPACGREKNEQLHRLLNRSLIAGATTVSIELAITLLTILFYYHSNKSSALKHECNSRVVPVVPINGMDNLLRPRLLAICFPFETSAGIMGRDDIA